MAVQVMLISPALNAALREARFDGDAPLDAAGVRRAGAVAAAVPAADRYLHGPSERCAGTADALGLRAGPEPALHGWDLGRWSGRRLAAVSAAEPDGVSAWLTDPSAAPHGGESCSNSAPGPDAGWRRWNPPRTTGTAAFWRSSSRRWCGR